MRGAPSERSPQARDGLEIVDLRHEGAEIQTLASQTLKELPSAYRDYGRPASKYQMMRRLHVRDGAPYLVGRFYLDYELYRQGPPSQFRQKPTLPILHSIAADRIGKARQWMTIGMADVEMATLLRIPLNSPVAYVTRIALDRNGRVSISARESIAATRSSSTSSCARDACLAGNLCAKPLPLPS